MCKFCLGMLTGVFVCLVCVVVGVIMLNNGASRSSGGTEEVIEPLPELSDPVPVSSGPVSENSLPAQDETPRAQLLEPVSVSPSLPTPVPAEAGPESVTVARHELATSGNPPVALSTLPESPPPALSAGVTVTGPDGDGDPAAPVPTTPLPVVPIAVPDETPPPPLAAPPVTAPPGIVVVPADQQDVPPPPPAPPAPVQATWVPVTQADPPVAPPPAGIVGSSYTVPASETPPPPPPATMTPPIPVSSDPPPTTGAAPVAPAPEPPARAAIHPLPTVRTALMGTGTEGTLLTGTYPCTVEEDRQVKLPQAAREMLGESPTVLVTPGPSQCLLLCTPADLAQLIEQLDRAVKDDEAACALRRLYFAQTEKCPVDADGRLAIPKVLADFAGLQREAVVVGVGDHLEMWDTERWLQYLEQRAGREKSEANR